MVIVITQSDAKDLLCFVLLDHKPIQVSLSFPRLIFELKRVLFGTVGGTGGRCGRFARGCRSTAATLKLLPHEIRQLPLELLRREWTAGHGTIHTRRLCSTGPKSIMLCRADSKPAAA